MIDRVDALLRDVLLADVPELQDEAQVRFQPPDDSWRSYVATLTVAGRPANAVNLYLVDVRENRKLRSNERERTFLNGSATDQPAPARLDCHYLLTAWSPATVSPAVEPTLDEHALLYAATATFLTRGPLNATRVYGPGSPALATLPAAIRDTDLPTRVVPPDGFAKLPEFWGAVGPNARWRPAAWLVVTVPVVLAAEVAGPRVTTTSTTYRRSDDGARTVLQLGGLVTDGATPPAPVPGALVVLETPTGVRVAAVVADGAGRFVFDRVEPGAYRLRCQAPPRPEPPPRAVTVPSPTGEYDLAF